MKWRIVNYGVMPEGLSEKFIFLFKLLYDPFILSGFFSAFIASFFWMAAMTKFEVSYVYPFITAGLTILTVFFAIILLGESINIQKISGVFFIICGVILIGFRA
ncbi:MAG: EamA family transporter [Gammaproteobacteria bacterium]|nr:EamA family transporter [Gammaproteobacteria bacterium]